MTLIMKGTSNACLAPLQKRGGGASIFSQFIGESYMGGGGCYKTPVNMLLYKVNTNKTIDHLMQYFWQSSFAGKQQKGPLALFVLCVLDRDSTIFFSNTFTTLFPRHMARAEKSVLCKMTTIWIGYRGHLPKYVELSILLY